MAKEDPFSKDVFPAELTEIYRRRWSISKKHATEGVKVEHIPPRLKDLDEAETVLHDAEKKLREARATNSMLRQIRKLLRIRKPTEAETELEKLQADAEDKRQKLADLVRPSVQLGLVGLAFSGGGIRSATFNLGILQGLADLGILRFFDYLSTVSGGGYIGSWLSAWIWHERENSRGGMATVATQLKPALSVREREAFNAPAAAVGDIPPQCGPDPIFHLRRYSNYLTPRLGIFSQDTWTGIATYVRNVLLIQLMLIPTLAIVLLIPRVLAKGFYKISDDFWLWAAFLAFLLLASVVLVSVSSALNRLRQPAENHFDLRHFLSWISVPAITAAFIFSWLFGIQRVNLEKLKSLNWLLQGLLDKENFRFHYWALLLGVLNVVVYLICALVHRGDKFHGVRITSDFVSGFVAGVLLYALLYFGLWDWAEQGHVWNVVSFGPPLFLIAFLVATTVQVGLRAATETDAAREWRASMGAWLLIYALVWAALFAISFYGPLGWELLLAWTKTKAALILAWLGSTLATALAGKSSSTGKPDNPSKLEWITKAGPVIAVLGLLIATALVSHKIVAHWSEVEIQEKVSLPPPVDARKRTIRAELGGTIQVESEQIKVDVNVKSEKRSDREAITKQYWTTVGAARPEMLAALIGLCVLVAGILAYRVDVNEFSLHAAYRNRLVRCYLGASRGKQRSPDPITGFDPHDDLPLANLRPGPDYEQGGCYDGPYLIINTALNQMAGKELAWQQRKATSFVLTPHFCGSGETGYRETEDFCGCMELGTAFAISGAAVSPNMGYHSSGPIAFLLTLFNVRLGWWVRNPKSNGQYRGKMHPVRFPYLVSELFGQTTADSDYVYLSDGGHFENLGIYELVRRRCKYIVCCDAGADPLIRFEDLGNAIRKIRTDLGVSVEIDLDMIHPEASQSHSRWHQVMGLIRYDQVDADESVGTLVYIKASLTGDEPGDVLEHASQHASFPHDTTADQFFDESQFEAYRKLGEHVAWEAFRCAQVEVQNDEAAIFNSLRHYWVSLPPRLRDSFLGQQDALVRLEAKLRDDPQLASYDVQIYPELESLLGVNTSSWPAPDPRAALHFCNMQLDLMENVFLALELQKYHGYALNRGWMNLFRRWATTPIFQKLWPGMRGGYSRQFGEFVEENLLPGTTFQIVNQIPQTLVPRLLDAFDRDQLSKEIAPKFPAALNAPLTLNSISLATWFAVPEGNQPVTEGWGVAVVTKEGSASYDYQLFVWVRGAYRNLGLGGKLLDDALLGLTKGGLNGKLLVDLGEEKPGNPGHQQRTAAWLRLYGQRGFVREFDRTRLRLTLQL
jgi:GNAT superfamily N-acetyltransferase